MLLPGQPRALTSTKAVFTSPLVASFLLSHSNIDTVYPNSIRVYTMLIDDDSFGCLGVPTPLEMLKQQSALLCDEIADLSDRLRRSRTNVAELIEMNQQLAAERDALRVKLASTEARISDCPRQRPESEPPNPKICNGPVRSAI